MAVNSSQSTSSIAYDASVAEQFVELYVVGISCGCTLATFILLLVLRGKQIVNPRRGAPFILQGVFILSMFYFQVKYVQITGGGDCGVLETLSLIGYLGAHICQYVFYIVRYVQVYGFNKPFVIPAIVLTVIFASSLPTSIFSNYTEHTSDGGCVVVHPPISALMPSITGFVLSVALVAMFVSPLLRSAHAPSNPGDINKRELGKLILATNLVAIISSVFFNATLSTVVGTWASMTSSIDLAINYLMSTLPYIATFYSKKTNVVSSSGRERRGSYKPASDNSAVFTRLQRPSGATQMTFTSGATQSV